MARDPFRVSTAYADERFDNVMSYVNARLSSPGTGRKVTIRSDQDLRELFERLDEGRQGTGKKGAGQPRFSDDFIDLCIRSRRAQQLIGAQGTIGRGRPLDLRRSKVIAGHRARGKQLYRYGRSGVAIKTGAQVRDRSGRLRFVFRDAFNGRPVDKERVEGDYEDDE